MDIQIKYQNQQTTFSGVQSYEDLLQEIQQKYPSLINIELSYVDEDGDTIQVSNTSDIIAIVRTDLNSAILQMEAQIDQQKIQDLERAKKIEELKQKRFEEKKRKIFEETEKINIQIEEINQEKIQLENEVSQKIEDLTRQCEQLKQFQNQPLGEFKQAFYESNLFDLIREKESELLLLEDQRGFDTQLKAIQKEVQEAFEKLFSIRALQHQEKFKKWLDSIHQINDINQQIRLIEKEKQVKLSKFEEKQKVLQEKLQQTRAKLNLPQEDDDQF